MHLPWQWNWVQGIAVTVCLPSVPNPILTQTTNTKKARIVTEQLENVDTLQKAFSSLLKHDIPSGFL